MIRWLAFVALFIFAQCNAFVQFRACPGLEQRLFVFSPCKTKPILDAPNAIRASDRRLRLPSMLACLPKCRPSPNEKNRPFPACSKGLRAKDCARSYEHKTKSAESGATDRRFRDPTNGERNVERVTHRTYTSPSQGDWLRRRRVALIARQEALKVRSESMIARLEAGEAVPDEERAELLREMNDASEASADLSRRQAEYNSIEGVRATMFYRRINWQPCDAPVVDRRPVRRVARARRSHRQARRVSAAESAGDSGGDGPPPPTEPARTSRLFGAQCAGGWQ